MDNQLNTDLKLDLSHYGRNDTVNVIHDALLGCLQENKLTGMRLAPVRQLAQQVGVARQTMQKVYNRLEGEGMITRMPGKHVWSITGRSHDKHLKCFGIILPASFSEYFRMGTVYGQLHFRMYSGLVDRAVELGYTTTPVFLPPPQSDRATIDRAIAEIKEQCGGLVHLGYRSYDDDLPLEAIARHEEIPQISFSCEFNRFNIGAVTFDPDYTARTVIGYLREYGHRNICLAYARKYIDAKNPINVMITTPDDIRKRFENAGAGQVNLSYMLLPGQNDREAIRRELNTLLAQKNPPTAFWCRNDDAALELVRVLKEMGHRVPQDFSVIGFNNIAETETSDPPLTTFNNPLYEMGRTVANRLAEYIRDGIRPENRVARLQPVLVARGSVAQAQSHYHQIA